MDLFHLLTKFSPVLLTSLPFLFPVPFSHLLVPSLFLFFLLPFLFPFLLPSLLPFLLLLLLLLRPAQLHLIFKPLMHILLLVWKNSRHYNKPARLVVLMREMCNAVINQVGLFEL